MANVRARFTLAERKKTIYALVVVAFLAISSLYFRRTLAAADKAAVSLLRAWSDVARANLNKALNLDAKQIQMALIGAAPAGGGEPDAEWLEEFFHRLADSYPGQTFFHLAEDGLIRDSRGLERGRLQDSSAREKSRSDGAALAAFLNLASDSGARPLVKIVPLAAAGYVIHVVDGNEFARDFLASLSVAGDYLALFDAGGRAVSEVVKVESGEDRAMQEELRQGVAGFLQSGESQSFSRRGWRISYHGYLRLDTGEGLVLGARIPAAQLLPFFDDLRLFAAAVFLSILFLITLIIVLDVINDRAKAREFRQISFIDLLTGLLNELGLQAAVKDFLDRGLAGDNSLICFDMANFRRFNAMFGYAAGDKALRAAAGVLRANYSFGARISGDVFVCLTRTSDESVEVLNQRLISAAREEVGAEYLDLLSFKYGVYPMRGPKHTFGEVYDGALLALRNAKKTPKRRDCVYDAELQKQAALHKKIELYMLHAMSKGEFHLFIQPKYDLAAVRCGGGEALVRWQSDDIGPLMPGDFIPLFEKNGFIVELDFYVLTTIFKNLKKELDQGREPYRLSINQSRATIVFPNYLARLKNIIRQYNVPTGYVELEITESFLAHDYRTVVALMYQLKDLGFSIAMDDFGSGYSSLNTLRELPVDTLKIDKAFLDESDNSTRSRTIIRNIINMSHELGVNVVCEGVETEQQLRFLTEAGCDVIQGFYYSAPIAYRDYVANYSRAARAPGL